LGVGWDNAYPAELQGLLRKKGIDANVTHAGVLLDRTGWMLRRLDSAVPEGTHIVILQPGANDLRFFGTKEERAANITAMVNRLSARGILRTEREQRLTVQTLDISSARHRIGAHVDPREALEYDE
jgi:hypothetical protein